jgi:hypothetical protein
LVVSLGISAVALIGGIASACSGYPFLLALFITAVLWNLALFQYPIPLRQVGTAIRQFGLKVAFRFTAILAIWLALSRWVVHAHQKTTGDRVAVGWDEVLYTGLQLAMVGFVLAVPLAALIFWLRIKLPPR